MSRRVLTIVSVAVGLALASVILYASASYPTSVKSFSTKLAGQTISAAHINDIQDEIAAIETAMLTSGFAHALKPSVTGAQDLGTSGLHWGTLYVNAINGVSSDYACGRLTLTSGTAVTTSDVTAATTIYYTPHGCNLIALYDGAAAWATVAFSEISIAVPATTSQMYDLWVYSNSGTATLEALAWTNDTTRATALVRQDGRYVKTGATTRRYVGSFRTTTVSGQTEDSAAKRYLWNYYNRAFRRLYQEDGATSYTYSTGSFRQSHGATTEQVEAIVGVADTTVMLTTAAMAANTSAGVTLGVAIGVDSTSSPTSAPTNLQVTQVGNINVTWSTTATIVPVVGRHFFARIEYGGGSGTTTWQTVTSLGLSGPNLLNGWIHG